MLVLTKGHLAIFRKRPAEPIGPARNWPVGRRGLGGFPAMGKEWAEVFGAGGREQRRQTAKHVAQIDERGMAVTLRGGQEAEVDGRGPIAAVAAAEEPVLAFMRSST